MSIVSRPRATWIALAIAAATFLLYLPVGENDFVTYDDGPYVTQNANVNAGLTIEGVKWAFLSSHSANWHPLTWLSHMLDCELFGLEPAGHHLMAAGLHALNAALCFIAFLLLTRKAGASLVIAAWFAVHPQRVESVAWIAERKDVLSGTFFFLTLIAWSLYVRRADANRPAKRLYLVAAVMLALGLLAKQMLVTLPAVLLMLDWGPLKRCASTGCARVLRDKLPLFLLCLAAGVATLLAQDAGSAIRTFDALPIATRISNAFVAFAAYAVRIVWPMDLAVFYPHPGFVAKDTYSIVGPRVLASAAAFVAVTILAWRARRTYPWFLAGWAWYVGMLLPVIGILQVGAQWMADRYAYLPVIGLYAAVVMSTQQALRSERARRVATIVGLAGALALVPLTRQQIHTWRDTQTLFEHALQVTDRNYVAHSNLGFLYHNEGDLVRAEEHYLAALEIIPSMADQHSNLGALYLARGDFPEARDRFDRALRINPKFTEARLLLGLLHDQRGDAEAALAAYRDAVTRDPSSHNARVALGRALLQRGMWNEALEHAERGVALAPNDPAARVVLGRSLAASGRASDALSHLRRALAHPTRVPEATEALVWLLATTKDTSIRDCVLALEYAAQLNVNRWQARRARAAAHACAGQFDLARADVDMLLAIAPPAERKSLMKLRERIKSKQAVYE